MYAMGYDPKKKCDISTISLMHTICTSDVYN